MKETVAESVLSHGRRRMVDDSGSPSFFRQAFRSPHHPLAFILVSTQIHAPHPALHVLVRSRLKNHVPSTPLSIREPKTYCTVCIDTWLGLVVTPPTFISGRLNTWQVLKTFVAEPPSYGDACHHNLRLYAGFKSAKSR